MSTVRSLTLYSDGFWISPYVFTCFVALREKGLRFDVQERKLEAAEQRDARYRADTWTGRVPALSHGDFWLSESSAIVEYLEDAFPAPAHPRVLPEAVEGRARARQLLSWLRSDETLPVRNERSAEVLFFERPRPPLSVAAATSATRAIAMAKRFLDERGDEWSIAHAELAFFVHRLWDDDLIPDDLREFASAQWVRPSVAEYVAHQRRPFVPYG